jgi:membrane protein
MRRRRRASEPKVEGGSRVQAVQDWLRRRADTPVGRLSLQWFRAYFAASRNSGCAISLYSSLSVLPAALVIIAVLYAPGGQTNAFAKHLVDHLNLTGSTAQLVLDTFGTASSNAVAASVATAVTFLLWGIGIGQLYQDVYARAWGVTIRSQAADQGHYAIFFFVFSGAIALATIAQAELGDRGRVFLFAALWVLGSCAFWIAVPWFLLHGQVGLRALLPGALLAAVVIGGAVAFSPLFLPPTMVANGKAFGSFGVVLTLVGWLFVLITLSLVCAVFAPVWADWRRLERERRAEAPASPEAFTPSG